MYLPRYISAVTTGIYFELVKQHTKEKRPKVLKIFKTQAFEVWWNQKMTTMSRLSHDKADLVIWERNCRKYFIVCIVAGSM